MVHFNHTKRRGWWVIILLSMMLALNVTWIVDAANLKPGDILVLETMHPLQYPGDEPVGKVVAIDPTTGAKQIVSQGGYLIDPTGIVVSPEGEIYVTNDDFSDINGGVTGHTGDALIKIDPATGAQTIVSQGDMMVNPKALAMDVNGDLIVGVYDYYVTNTYDALVRINPDTREQIYYDGSTNLFLGIANMAMEPAGTLLIQTNSAPSYIHRMRFLSGANLEIIAGCNPEPGKAGPMAVNDSGSIFMAGGASDWPISGTQPPVILRLNSISTDLQNLQTCDTSVIYEEDGVPSTVFTQYFQGIAVAENGTIFVLNYGNLYSVNPNSGEPTFITNDFYNAPYNARRVAIFNTSVLPTELRVIAPNGGEVIQSPTTYTIEWDAPTEAVSFEVQFSSNNGKKWQRLATGISGSTYQWVIPGQSKDSTKCLIKVIGYNNSGSIVGEDISDGVFKIAKAPRK